MRKKIQNFGSSTRYGIAWSFKVLLKIFPKKKKLIKIWNVNCNAKTKVSISMVHLYYYFRIAVNVSAIKWSF